MPWGLQAVDAWDDSTCLPGALALLDSLTCDQHSLIGFAGSGVAARLVQTLLVVPDLRLEPHVVGLAANLGSCHETLEVGLP